MPGQVLDQIECPKEKSHNAHMSNHNFSRSFRGSAGNSGSCATAMIAGRSRSVLRKGLVFRDDSHLLAEGVKAATDHGDHYSSLVITLGNVLTFTNLSALPADHQD